MTLDQRLRRLATQECLPEMRRVAPEADIRINVTNRVPAFAADTRSEIVPLALQLGQQNATFAVKLADYVHVMSQGRIVHASNPEALWKNEGIKTQYLGGPGPSKGDST